MVGFDMRRVRPTLIAALGVALAAGCPRPGPDDSTPPTDSDPPETDEPAPSEPILVYWTIDTLGAYAAQQAGWCGKLRGVLAEYGLTAACYDDVVAPSSWTGESHTRLL